MNSTATREIPADGSPLAYTAGAHTVHLQRTIENGFSLYVTAGPTQIGELDDSFTDETLARHAARTVCVRLNAGESIHTLIAEKQAAQQDLISAVNATMDQAHADLIAPRQQARNIGAFATPARVNTRPLRALSPAMIRALRAEKDGVIHVQPGITQATLRCLATGGLGTTTGTAPRRADVAYLTLNQRGQRMAAEQKAAA